MFNQRDEEEQSIIDELIESLELEEPNITNDEKKKHSKNQSSSAELVKEEYEILMDMDSDYFVYGKTK